MSTIVNQLKKTIFFTLSVLILMGCEKETKNDIIVDESIILPEGFEAIVVVDSVKERIRHLTVSNNGVIYAKLQNSDAQGTLLAVKDTVGNVKADLIEKFAGFNEKEAGYATGAKIYNGYLYYSTELYVYRIKLRDDTIVPDGDPELILTDEEARDDREHVSKPLAFDDSGHMYVPFGAPSNACQDPERTPGVAGQDPCPQLETRGGIWKFDANKTNQTQKDGVQYATGIRSVTAMDWNPQDKNLYVAMHGRDNLRRLFPEKYDAWTSAVLPSEEFIKVTEGSNFGWPYCYYDQIQGKKVLAPEYGGDGKIVGQCDQYDEPVYGFPGHWAPNDLIFYNGNQFPDRYKNGAFIAFHGSTDRVPYPQSGYIVAFLPFKDGRPVSEYEVFADGFAIVDPIVSVNDAERRPMGLAVGPDGEMYIADSVKGTIWKIIYKGNKDHFGDKQLAAMEERKLMTHLRVPDKIKDNLLKASAIAGEKVYNQYCTACHQSNGKGSPGRFPPLVKNDWVNGDKERLIKIILNGMDGNLVLNDQSYSGLMPQHSFLKDKEIAEVLSYIRTNFGNNASQITQKEVQKIRVKQEESGEKITPINAQEAL